MYTVMMSFDYGDTWYPYGTYDEHRANEIAMQVRDERGCWVSVGKAEG